MPTKAAKDPVLVPSVTFQSLQYLRLVFVLNLFLTWDRLLACHFKSDRLEVYPTH